MVVRDGTAIVFSEFGQQPVRFGDAILLGSSVLCGIEPEGSPRRSTPYPRRFSTWIGAELVSQRLPYLFVGAQCCRGLPVSCKCANQERMGALTGGMFTAEVIQLRQDATGFSGVGEGVQAVFDGAQTERLQPNSLAVGEIGVDPTEQCSPPHAQSLVEHGEGSVGSSSTQ